MRMIHRQLLLLFAQHITKTLSPRNGFCAARPRAVHGSDAKFSGRTGQTAPFPSVALSYAPRGKGVPAPRGRRDAFQVDREIKPWPIILRTLTSCFVTNERHPARSAHRSVRRSPPAAVRSSRRDSRAQPTRARYSSSSTRRARIRSSRTSSTARSGLSARSRSSRMSSTERSGLPARSRSSRMSSTARSGLLARSRSRHTPCTAMSQRRSRRCSSAPDAAAASAA